MRDSQIFNAKVSILFDTCIIFSIFFLISGGLCRSWLLQFGDLHIIANIEGTVCTGTHTLVFEYVQCTSMTLQK